MSNVIPFHQTAADRSAEWLVHVSLTEEIWWEVAVDRDGQTVASEAFSTYEQASAAARMIRVLHGFDLRVPNSPFEVGNSRLDEVPF